MLFRALLIWGVLLILEGIVVILLVPPTLIVNAGYKEEEALVETLGQEAAEAISTQARDRFKTWFVDTGIMAESFALLVPSEASKRQSAGLETLAEGVFEVVRRRLEAAWNLVFVGIQRTYGFFAWLPLLLPFIVACAFDGGMKRRVKLLTFGMSSAPLYGAAMHGLLVLAFFPLYYAAWPFPAPPLIIPIWFIALALTARSLISNLQRM